MTESDDLPPLESLGGRRRVDVDLESLSLPDPAEDCPEPQDEVSIAADMLGRLLAYGTQSRSVSTMGKRFWAMVYVLRPDLLDGQTMESFGRQSSASRQSIEQYVREFRMTFGIWDK